jgi:ComF family protein
VFPFTGLLDLLCPPICPICGAVIDNPPGQDAPLCSTCVSKIVTPDGRFCRRCGGRRFVTNNNLDECPRCRTTPFRFKRAIALGEYAGDLRTLALRMKTDRIGILASAAAKALALYRRMDLETVCADYIVPVPMHRLRRWDRGVNSPDLRAEELGLRLKTPVVRNLVRRIRPTDLQYTLSPTARAENVSGAFGLCPPHLLAKWGFQRFRLPIAGKHILLVDDILTTGSTCNEIAKVLLAADVGSVTVAALARAEGDYARQHQ